MNWFQGEDLPQIWIYFEADYGVKTLRGANQVENSVFVRKKVIKYEKIVFFSKISKYLLF